jgi:hypothetical protein
MVPLVWLCAQVRWTFTPDAIDSDASSATGTRIGFARHRAGGVGFLVMSVIDVDEEASGPGDGQIGTFAAWPIFDSGWLAWYSMAA